MATGSEEATPVLQCQDGATQTTASRPLNPRRRDRRYGPPGGRAANQKRDLQRKGRKRSGSVPAAAAAAICHLVASAPPVSPAEPAPRPVTSRLRSRLCLLLGMDLVGVSSPEPGPAAAWGPRKVSGGRGWHTCRAHAGCWSPEPGDGTPAASLGRPRVVGVRLGLCPAFSVCGLDGSGTPHTDAET